MRADDLKLGELVDFSEGWFHLHGRRLVLHDIHAFAQFRKDLIEMVGPEQGRRILTRFGYFWGQADAAAMKRLFQWDTTSEWLKAGPRMHGLQGVVRSVIKKMKIDEKKGRFNMQLNWYDSGEAEEHQIAFGRTDHPVCWMLVGYASGYASFCMNREIYFREEKCRAKGDRICTAKGLDQESWGEEPEEFLPFFQANDIHGTIINLTEELKRKSKELNEQRRRLEQLERKDLHGLVEVRSRSFRHVLDLALRIAAFDTSVLITGETGVGKDVVARYIHKRSKRSDRPFLAVNCGALPETLLESELFGYKAGAFTGATSDRKGLFEQSHRGTLCLDEIGDISPAMQTKLLRVIQERELVRLGENKPRKVDVRLIAATNRDLNRAVDEGNFRRDLLYRLRVIEIVIPPLRERKEDILPLVRHFVERFSKKLNLPDLRLDATCLDYLQAYAWPGNVRELENAVEHAAVLSKDGNILPQNLPSEIVQSRAMPSLDVGTRSLKEVETEYIRAVLEMTGGNRARAARILEISPATLWRKLKQTP